MTSDLAFRHLPRGTDVKARKVSFRIFGVPTAIRTGYISNTDKRLKWVKTNKIH
jgi:hypothetical protein